MATALIRGLLAKGTRTTGDIVASDPNGSTLDALRGAHGIRTQADNATAVREGDIVVLAVKPQMMGAVLPEVAAALSPNALVVSIAAGVPLAVLERGLPNAAVVRSMPNTPALVGEGITAIAAGSRANDDDLADAESLLASVGFVVRVPEAQLDAVTGLSGSGPAYVFRMIEALVDGGVAAGLERNVAAQLAAQTVLGAARLLRESGEAPTTLRARVTSPGGTTEAGLAELEERGFHAALVAAVQRATARSKELGAQARKDDDD
jgi:pyrroline-5-carboxylate reductase